MARYGILPCYNVRLSRLKCLPWEMGKSFDYSVPSGPIHQIEATGAIRKGAISLSVNGALRQKGDIGQMIWNVSEIIGQLSSQYELFPGDIILTGTPAGVGALVPGDVVDCSIERLGTLQIHIGPKSKLSNAKSFGAS